MKKLFIILTIGLFSISAFSQYQQNKHEFTVWAGGPISTLRFDAPAFDADQVMRFGFQAGIGYNYFFNYNWSLGAGLEFSMLNGKLKYNTIEGSYYAWDNTPQQEMFILNYGTTYYEEPQNVKYLNIPLQVKFQNDAWKNHKYYIAAGPKIGIPLQGSFKHYNTFSTSFQYLDSYNRPSGDALQPDGTQSFLDRGIGYFGTYGNEDLDLRVNLIASIEGGIKWKLNEKLDLYTGLYLDYGLTDIRTKSSSKLGYNPIQINESYNQIRSYNHHSFLQSQANGVNFVDKVNTLSFGVKAALAFGKSPFTKKGKVLPPPVVEKPYEGLTAAQMEDILARNTKELIEFQRKEFEALRDLITKEDPELTQAIINFDLDKRDILPRMHYELDKKVDLLNKYPKAKLMLEGHTDDLGSDAYNMQLGLDRANAAKAYLVAKGINPNRLSVSTKGKTQPIVSNSNDTNRFYNRRVEFILVQ